MALSTPGPLTPLRDAKEWLRGRLADGEKCPCCTQFAKVYRRPVTATSAYALVRLYRVAGRRFAHFPTVLGRKQADEAKMLYWGLIEDEGTLRTDGGRAGWWRVTEFGERWIGGGVTIPKYALIYDSRCLGLEGPPVTIEEALGERFDLAALMAEPIAPSVTRDATLLATTSMKGI